MQKNKDGSRWKNSSKKVFKEKRDKDKSSIIFYKCKKPEHLKSEYINLENSKYKHKQYKSMGKKGLMSTQKDLDDTSSNQEGEEKANLCLMDDTTSKESESNQEEVDFNSPQLSCYTSTGKYQCSNMSYGKKMHENDAKTNKYHSKWFTISPFRFPPKVVVPS